MTLATICGFVMLLGVGLFWAVRVGRKMNKLEQMEKGQKVVRNINEFNRKVDKETREKISNNGYFIIEHSNGEKSKIEIPTYERVNIKNASGPFSSSNGEMDFIDLIVGSEGIFGCIIESTLKLQERPSDYLNLFVKLKVLIEIEVSYS